VRRWPGLAGSTAAAWLASQGVVRAAPLSNTAVRQLHALNTAQLDRDLAELGRTAGMPGLSVGTVVHDLLTHQNPFSVHALIAALVNAVGGDVLAEGRLLGILLVLTVVGAVVMRLADAFPGRDVAKIAQLVVTAALVAVALSSFGMAVAMVSGMMKSLLSLMEASIPVVIVLMASSGAVTSAGLFHPLIISAVNLVALATTDWVLPLVLLAVGLEVVSAWMPEFRLSQLANLLKQVAMFSLGGLLTLFLAAVAIENAAGKVADGLALRTGKFLTNAAIPVVGKLFSDAMDVVLRSSGLLLTAVGVTVALGVMVTVAFPLVKVLVLSLFYRLAAAGSEPLGVTSVGRTLSVMAGGLGLLAAVGAAVALMFFLTVSMVVSTASGVAP
jgi:stage III sporulation protein AE